MAGTRIEMAGPRATIRARDRIVSDVLVADADRFIIAYRGNPLYQGDEPFFAVTFPTIVWVIPAFAAGIQPFIEAAARSAQQHDGIFRGTAERLPWEWRRRAFGVLPVFSEVALGAHPPSSLPQWQLDGPLDIAAAPEIAAN